MGWIVTLGLGVPCLGCGVFLAFLSVRMAKKATTTMATFKRSLVGLSAALTLSFALGAASFGPLLGPTGKMIGAGLSLLVFIGECVFSGGLYLQVHRKTEDRAPLALAITNYCLAGLIVALGLVVYLG